jgi:hypothetical protein
MDNEERTLYRDNQKLFIVLEIMLFFAFQVQLLTKNDEGAKSFNNECHSHN